MDAVEMNEMFATKRALLYRKWKDAKDDDRSALKQEREKLYNEFGKTLEDHMEQQFWANAEQK